MENLKTITLRLISFLIFSIFFFSSIAPALNVFLTEAFDDSAAIAVAQAKRNLICVGDSIFAKTSNSPQPSESAKKAHTTESFSPFCFLCILAQNGISFAEPVPLVFKIENRPLDEQKLRAPHEIAFVVPNSVLACHHSRAPPTLMSFS